MAQLSDDCFAFGGPMMSVDEAVGLIATRVSRVEEVETVSLAEADGRILAHDIAAPLPLPPFTNSAVDGYAIASRDLPKAEAEAFPVVGRVQAGASPENSIRARHAVRIFTGAPMPAGADTVFMQEDVKVEVTPEGLTITGERKEEKEEKKEGYFRTERVYGAFERFVPLPDGAVLDKAAAEFKDGVLTVTVPLGAVPKPETKTLPIA